VREDEGRRGIQKIATFIVAIIIITIFSSNNTHLAKHTKHNDMRTLKKPAASTYKTNSDTSQPSS
jgi:hypothetical protein